MCEKGSFNMHSCGLVNREQIISNKDVADNETPQMYGDKPPSDVASKVMESVVELGEKKALRTDNVLASASAEYHTRGSVTEDQAKTLRRMVKNRTRKHKQAQGKTKEERKEEILARRAESQRKRDIFNLAYEGWALPVQHTISGLLTPSQFKDLFASFCDKVKSTINGNKFTVEHVLKLDSDKFMKALMSFAAVGVGAMFAAAFGDIGSFFKFLVASLTLVCASYPWVEDLLDLFKNWVLEYYKKEGVVQMKDFDPKECSQSVQDWLEKLEAESVSSEKPPTKEAFHQENSDNMPWNLAEHMQPNGESSGPTIVSHEGIFESTPALWFILADLACAGVTLMTGFLPVSLRSTIVRTTGDMARMHKDIAVIGRELLKLIVSFIDKLFGTSLRDMFLASKELDGWGDAVCAIYKEFIDQKLGTDSYSMRRLNNLTLQGLDIAKKFGDMDSTAWNYHRHCSAMLNRMATVFGNKGAVASERPVPLSILLRGESGIGKSYITKSLIDAIAMRTMSEEEAQHYVNSSHKHIYFNLTEEDHMNGYNGQYAVIMDDFGQFATQKGQIDDMCRIIRFCNAISCRLNCAELERKGVVSFTSNLVVASSNLYQYWSPSVVKPEAVVRRFDVVIDMVPRIEFCRDGTDTMASTKRRLDINKVKDALPPGKKIHYDACEYRLMRVADAEQQIFVVEKVCTFEEILDICVKKFEAHRDDYEGLQDEMRQRREELLQERVVHDCVSNAIASVVGGHLDYEGLYDVFKTITDYAIPVVSKVHDFIHPKQETFGLSKQLYDLYQGAYQTFKAGMQRVYRSAKMGEYKILVAILLAIVGFVGCIFAAVKLFTSVGKKGNRVPHYEADYDLPIIENDYARGCFQATLIASIYAKNIYHMYNRVEDVDKAHSFGKVTFVTGTKCLMNRHYLDQFKSAVADGHDFDVVFANHGKSRRQHKVALSWLADPAHHVSAPNSDVALVQMPSCFNTVRDITKHFITSETVALNRDNNVTLYLARGPGGAEPHYLRSLGHVSKIKACDGVVHDRLLTYSAPTKSGDCGSLLAFTGSYAKSEQCIVGFHMGRGAESTKYGSIVTQSVLQNLLARLKPEPKIVEPIHVEGGFLPNHDTCHELVDVVDRPLMTPARTVIRKSKIFGMMATPTKYPALLSDIQFSDGTVVKPMLNALLKQDAYNVTVPVDDLEACVQDVIRVLKPHVQNVDRVLSFEEAVSGAEDLKHMKGIPRATSLGYPHCQDPRIVLGGKKDAFGAEGDYQLTTELALEYRAEVEQWENTAAELIVPKERIFGDILKDETRPLSKVLAGKTRMISASDIVLSLVVRKYYGGVINDIMRSRIVNGIAVGINPYSREWDFLKKMVTSKGESVIAGDFSDFDNSQSRQMIMAVMKVLNTLTGHNDKRSRNICECMAVALSQPYHINGRHVYELDHGMPSGNPMTTIINSIFGLLAFRLAWLRLAKPLYSTRALCLQGFNDHVFVQMYGDDNLLNVSEDCKEFFNQNTLMAVMPEFGLKYTSDDKEDLNPLPVRDIANVTFLKRHFRYEMALGRYVAPLAEDTIFSMLDWTKKGASKDAITLENCSNALREWSLHGREKYESHGAKLADIVDRVFGEHLMVQPYRAQLEETTKFVPLWIAEHS